MWIIEIAYWNILSVTGCLGRFSWRLILGRRPVHWHSEWLHLVVFCCIQSMSQHPFNSLCVCMLVNITIEYCLNGVLISADSFSLCILNYTATSIASNPFLFPWSKRKKVDKSCRMHNITTNGEHRKVTSNQDLHPKTQGFHQWIVLYVGEDDTWR